jgi:mRNA interferase RelE/StbE
MQPSYHILYKKSVDKDLRKEPLATRQKIIEKILQLASNHTPAQSVKLKGSDNLYRLRHSEYRVIYQIRQAELVILVIKVGHRKGVYR